MGITQCVMCNGDTFSKLGSDIIFEPMILLDHVPAWQRQPIRASTILRLRYISNVRATIERYKKANAAASNAESVSEANTQFYQQESSKLRRQIRDIQNLNRHILGEALGSLSLKELKNLEGRLEKGLSRVRSRKEIELQNHNNYLRAKIAEHERAQQQQSNMNMSGTLCESLPSQSYDRNFFPVNLIASDDQQQYSRQDHTALQLLICWKLKLLEVHGSS
ncbi:Agamous-like MADS-box protein AGL1 [Glycine max]|nr:Agamous-like MADS-box protein AGL1 [Glycine max]